MTYIKLHIAETAHKKPTDKHEHTKDIFLELTPMAAKAIADQFKQYYSNSALPVTSFLEQSQKETEIVISEHLTNIGIPSGLSGYRYLLSAIRKVIEDESILDGITKILYPEIARLHNSTPQRVEKAIRHAIKTTWDNSSSLLHLDEYHFYIKKGRNYPTNSQFIAEIYRRIRLSSAL